MKESIYLWSIAVFVASAVVAPLGHSCQPDVSAEYPYHLMEPQLNEVKLVRRRILPRTIFSKPRGKFQKLPLTVNQKAQKMSMDLITASGTKGLPEKPDSKLKKSSSTNTLAEQATNAQAQQSPAKARPLSVPMAASLKVNEIRNTMQLDQGLKGLGERPHAHLERANSMPVTKRERNTFPKPGQMQGEALKARPLKYLPLGGKVNLVTVHKGSQRFQSMRKSERPPVMFNSPFDQRQKRFIRLEAERAAKRVVQTEVPAAAEAAVKASKLKRATTKAEMARLRSTEKKSWFGTTAHFLASQKSADVCGGLIALAGTACGVYGNSKVFAEPERGPPGISWVMGGITAQTAGHLVSTAGKLFGHSKTITAEQADRAAEKAKASASRVMDGTKKVVSAPVTLVRNLSAARLDDDGILPVRHQQNSRASMIGEPLDSGSSFSSQDSGQSPSENTSPRIGHAPIPGPGTAAIDYGAGPSKRPPRSPPTPDSSFTSQSAGGFSSSTPWFEGAIPNGMVFDPRPGHVQRISARPRTKFTTSA